MGSPCVCSACQLVPCQPGPSSARFLLILPLTRILATIPFPRVGPGAWEGSQPRTLAQGRAGVPVFAQWALACQQEQWKPEVAGRLASSQGQLPLQPCSSMPVAAGLAHHAALLQTNTNYSQEKHRCEYLHSKLAHIKRLIAEYDQRQLQPWP